MSPENLRDMQVQTRGEFGGLGIEVTMENGIIKVVSPIDDTPAAKAGLMANDLITHLDNEFDFRYDARAGGRENAWASQHADHAHRCS